MNLDSDKNLLFGILALQMDFVQREQLIAATSTWLTDKSRAIADILVEQNALSSSDRDLLAPLVARHLENHDGDPARSLASLSSVGSVADDLRSLGDEEVEATLSIVSTSSKSGSAPGSDGAGSSNDSGLRFRVLRPHAKGGLGEVSVAQDTEINREVALKQILPQYASDAQCQDRFTLEAEITGGLEHPGIVPVYGLGRYDDGRPFYAMRFIKGDSLQEAAKRMHSEGPVDYNSVEFRKLLGRFIDVCEAIEYAHSRGVLHRDLKPGNIMLGKYGETLVVDWGLAKIKGRDDLAVAGDEQTLRPASGSGAAFTRMGSALGTPAFMPPEQATGNLDQLGPASDIYSLGATLYYLLTAKRPFEANTLQEVLSAVQRGDFPQPRTVNPAIPKPLEAVCMQAMALQPSDRYASPMSLADDVQRWLGDEPVSACVEPLTARLQRWVRRHQTLAASFTALTFTGLVALAASTLLIGKAQQETAEALSKEQAARRDADEQREIAETALLKNRRISANLAFDRARELSDDGRPDIGLNWYARAMELAPEGDKAFHDLIRANLSEWNSETVAPKVQFHYRGGGDADGACLSRDGRLLYIFRPETGVIQWNTTTAKSKLLLLPGVETTIETLPRGGTLSASFPVALSPDEDICSAAVEKELYFWNVREGALIGDPAIFDSEITAIGYQPDGQAIAVGCKDGKCLILDIKSKQLVGKSLNHGKQLRAVAFRSDGEVLMTGGYDSTVRRWDLKTRAEIQPALKHDALGITAATWSPDGKRIASSDFRELRIWDVANGESVLSVSVTAGATFISFSEDGELLAFGTRDSLVRIWDAQSLRPLYHPLQHEGNAGFVAFDAASRHLVTLDESLTLRKWELPANPLSARPIPRLDHNRLDVDPAGEIVAYAGMRGTLVLCDTKTGEQLGTRDFQEPISSVTFNKQGNLILLTGFRGSSRVYATDGLEQVGKTIVSKGMAREGDFIDDDLVAISVMQEGGIRVHNFRTGETVGPVMKQLAPVSIDVINGKMIAEGHGILRTWSLESREERTPPIEFRPRTALRFSPNGERFGAGTNRHVTIWDADTAERIVTFPHPPTTDDLDFSRDNRLLATAAVDDNVRLWDVTTGKQVGPSRRTGNLTHVRFDDKNRLHFAGFDGSQLKHYIWKRPPRLKGNAETLRRWAAVRTGLELQPNGNLRVLPWREWNEAAEQLRSSPTVLQE